MTYKMHPLYFLHLICRYSFLGKLTTDKLFLFHKPQWQICLFIYVNNQNPKHTPNPDSPFLNCWKFFVNPTTLISVENIIYKVLIIHIYLMKKKE